MTFVAVAVVLVTSQVDQPPEAEAVSGIFASIGTPFTGNVIGSATIGTGVF